MFTRRTDPDTSTTPQATKKFGKSFLKWATRVVGVAATAIAYIKWKEVAEAYDFQSGTIGTYQFIVLGLAYYVLWVFTRSIDGSSYKDTERPGDDAQYVSRFEAALFALFVCVAIAIGFIAANFVYVEAIDRSVAGFVAQIFGFIAYIATAGTTLGILNRMAPS